MPPMPRDIAPPHPPPRPAAQAPPAVMADDDDDAIPDFYAMQQSLLGRINSRSQAAAPAASGVPLMQPKEATAKLNVAKPKVPAQVTQGATALPTGSLNGGGMSSGWVECTRWAAWSTPYCRSETAIA